MLECYLTNDNIQIMKRNIWISLIILAGLVFGSCKNNTSEKDQTQGGTELNTDNEKSTPVKEGVIVADFSEQSVDDALADKIKYYLNTEFLTEGDLRAISDNQRRFQLYKVDLNKDGNDEVFVNFMTPYFCGTGGCTVLLLDNNLELITRFSPMQTLYVEEQLENGWRVLMTESEGSWRKLTYENGTYPSNPSMVETTNDTAGDQAEIMFDAEYSTAKTYTF